MLLVALTGGIGSGKSTVAQELAGRGAPVVDADRIARQVVEPSGAAYGPLVARFGEGVLTASGAVDRPALAAVVFHDAAALADLNAITHPAIGGEIITQVAALATHEGPVVLDVPLLDRSTLAVYDPGALVVVQVEPEVAVARLVAYRGFTEADARARIRSQATNAERRELLGAAAHGKVIENSGSRQVLEEQVAATWQWLLGLDGGHGVGG